MADTNIFIGYDLGRGLAPTSATLPTDLAEPVCLAQFMDDVDCTLIVDGAGNYDWVKTGTCLREMAEKSMLVLPDVADPIARVGITLRLWAGCLWAAKPLDRPELSSEFRAQLFTRDIDPRAANDPLFRAGVEAAPAFNALPTRSGPKPPCLDGVPADSAVRRHL
jgi:hypothetical protein